MGDVKKRRQKKVNYITRRGTKIYYCRGKDVREKDIV